MQMTIQYVMELENNVLMGQKTLCEKEKLLVTSNFSFTHIVFQIRSHPSGLMSLLFGNGLNPYKQPNIMWVKQPNIMWVFFVYKEHFT